MKKIIITLILIAFTQTNSLATTFNDLKKEKTSYLDFVLLKIEQRLIQRHGFLGAQPVALRIQYQSVGSEIIFSEKDSKIILSIIGVMDKERYTQKKYKPKVSDCNILRNILLYGKYGYNLIFLKRNKYLTVEDMKDIFLSRFLNNLSLSEEEKKFIMLNTIAKVQVIDPVRGNHFYCSGKVYEDLK